MKEIRSSEFGKPTGGSDAHDYLLLQAMFNQISAGGPGARIIIEASTNRYNVSQKVIVPRCSNLKIEGYGARIAGDSIADYLLQIGDAVSASRNVKIEGLYFTATNSMEAPTKYAGLLDVRTCWDAEITNCGFQPAPNGNCISIYNGCYVAVISNSRFTPPSSGVGRNCIQVGPVSDSVVPPPNQPNGLVINKNWFVGGGPGAANRYVWSHTMASLGDIIYPTTVARMKLLPNAFVFEVTTAGSITGMEPNWANPTGAMPAIPTVEGDTISLGGAVVTARISTGVYGFPGDLGISWAINNNYFQACGYGFWEGGGNSQGSLRDNSFEGCGTGFFIKSNRVLVDNPIFNANKYGGVGTVGNEQQVVNLRDGPVAPSVMGISLDSGSIGHNSYNAASSQLSATNVYNYAAL